jgi:AcrR family transcriptional regulator
VHNIDIALSASYGKSIDETPMTGLREQKRQETSGRIAGAAMALFARDGYDATTIDAIAEAAGISRRTFFHYFKSKDEILTSMQGGMGSELLAVLADEPTGAAPLATMLAVMRRAAGRYSTEALIAIDKVMLASEAVQSRKQASYIRDEAALLAAFRQRWPDQPQHELRLVAMLSISLTRLALDAWREEGSKRPIVELYDEIVGALRASAGQLSP